MTHPRRGPPVTKRAVAPRHAIEIASRQRLWPVRRARLIAVARSVLEDERVTRAAISIALVDDAEIHAINRTFLGHDYPTDVISFLLEEQPPARASAASRSGALSRRGAGKSLEGEIIISVETARRLAAEFDWPTSHEVCLYLVHGLLHLCGYDDLTPAERELMRARELAVLAPWKIVPREID